MVDADEAGSIHLTRLTRRFEPDNDQVGAARRFVSSSLRAWGVEPADVPLLVSELATNAVLHARSDFSVMVCLDDDRVRVEVSDANPRLPALGAIPSDAHSGRGLMIVAEMAAAWGVESHPGSGKTIWFEVLAA